MLPGVYQLKSIKVHIKMLWVKAQNIGPIGQLFLPPDPDHPLTRNTRVHLYGRMARRSMAQVPRLPGSLLAHCFSNYLTFNCCLYRAQLPRDITRICHF